MTIKACNIIMPIKELSLDIWSHTYRSFAVCPPGRLDYCKWDELLQRDWAGASRVS